MKTGFLKANMEMNLKPVCKICRNNNVLEIAFHCGGWWSDGDSCYYLFIWQLN